jgi:hypothetical protein
MNGCSRHEALRNHRPNRAELPALAMKSEHVDGERGGWCTLVYGLRNTTRYSPLPMG